MDGGGANTKKKKKDPSTSKSKRKFMKMVEMDEGILFPLANNEYKVASKMKSRPLAVQQNPSISSGYNTLSYDQQ